MMLYPPLEDLLDKVENRYTLCLLASKRARQLVQGATPLVNEFNEKEVSVAILEIYNDKVTFLEDDD